MQKQRYHLGKHIRKRKRRKDLSRKISPPGGLATRFDCCNFSICWLKWWLQTGSIRWWGKSMEHRICWVYSHSGSGGKGQVPPWRWSFTLDDIMSWIMGCFGSPWHLLRRWPTISRDGQSQDLCECSDTSLAGELPQMSSFGWGHRDSSHLAGFSCFLTSFHTQVVASLRWVVIY